MGIKILGSPFWGFSDSLCYNLIRGAWTDASGRGLAFEGSARLTSLRFPVDKTPEIGYMGWKQLTLATLTTVRKDRKIKGFPQTHENKLGT